MKSMTLLICSLIISQAANADHRCKDYITDEWPNSRYTIEIIFGDNVVIDNKTKLMWKQCAEGLSGADCSTGILTSLTWQQSLDLANTTDFAGYNNWRVPNIKELRTIIARNCSILSINESVFLNIGVNKLWSSSPDVSNDGMAWLISLGYGFDERNGRGNSSRALLVRSPGQ